MTLTTITGHEPGTPAWMRLMSASKIPAALGISPWTSPFKLWHQMAGNIGPDQYTEAMQFGHDAEPMMRDWFTRQTGHTVNPGRTWLRDDWMLATPDGEINNDAILEIKTTSDEWEWRDHHDDGTWTRALPPYYHAQVQWQLGVTGRATAHIAVLFKQGCDREHFTVPFEPATFAMLTDTARDFLDTLTTGDPPPLDGSDATYQALRALHPDIDGTDTECDPWLAWRITQARREYDRAEQALTAAKNEALNLMGTSRRLTTDGTWVTRRQPARAGVSLYINRRIA